MGAYPPYRTPSTLEELITAGKYGAYALLVGYDNVNSKFRPIDVAYDENTGRSSLVMSRAHGKTTYSVELTANHAAGAEITPASGNYLAITNVFCCTDAAAGEVKLDFATSGIPVFRLYATKTSACASLEGHIEGVVDEVLTLTTTTGAQKVFLMINYREH